MGSETIAEVRDEGSFIWENEYDEEEKINSYDLTLFIREEDDLYRRYQETHFERAWSLDEIKRRSQRRAWNLWRRMTHLRRTRREKRATESMWLRENMEKRYK